MDSERDMLNMPSFLLVSGGGGGGGEIRLSVERQTQAETRSEWRKFGLRLRVNSLLEAAVISQCARFHFTRGRKIRLVLLMIMGWMSE